MSIARFLDGAVATTEPPVHELLNHDPVGLDAEMGMMLSKPSLSSLEHRERAKLLKRIEDAAAETRAAIIRANTAEAQATTARAAQVPLQETIAKLRAELAERDRRISVLTKRLLVVDHRTRAEHLANSATAETIREAARAAVAQAAEEARSETSPGRWAWAALRAMGGERTYNEIAAATGRGLGSVRMAISRARAAGYVEVAGYSGMYGLFRAVSVVPTTAPKRVRRTAAGQLPRGLAHAQAEVPGEKRRRYVEGWVHHLLLRVGRPMTVAEIAAEGLRTLANASMGVSFGVKKGTVRRVGDTFEAVQA